MTNQPRFFNPQNCIEHLHPRVASWQTVNHRDASGTMVSEFLPTCVDPPEHEIVIYQEGWGHIPVNGSGSKIKSVIPETKDKPIHCLTQEERDAFMRQYSPCTWDYEQEKINESLQSACL
jgi:hypothetical protein